MPEEAPPEVEALMLQCLDVDPNLRPSAREIVGRLSTLRLAPRPPLDSCEQSSPELPDA